jgi:hemoglobin
MNRIPLAAAALAVALALMPAASAQTTGAAPAATLYQTFGELPGLQRLAQNLVARAAADPRIASIFEKTDKAELAKSLSVQFCSLLQGPCKYEGPNMKQAHRDLGIAPAHFNALVEDLQLAMDAQGIPFSAQNRFLALLAPMHRDIIERP